MYTGMEQIIGGETMRIGAEWPASAPQQVEVMLLGTYHMDGGISRIDADVDDVLQPERQEELRTLAETLVDWSPDLVAVERPNDRSTRVNELYDEYRRGDRDYDEETEIRTPHPARNELDTECRSEVVQLGFRLADLLNHDRIASVDFPMHDIKQQYDAPFEQAIDRFMENLNQGTELPEKVGVPDINEDYVKALADRLQSRSIPEHLIELNREPALDVEQYHVFGQGLRMMEDEEPIGPRRITLWYDRNIRMCHYLWREMDETTERICFIVGNGHVSILRHLLTMAPMFCPVSALPYLHEATERLQDD